MKVNITITNLAISVETDGATPQAVLATATQTLDSYIAEAIIEPATGPTVQQLDAALDAATDYAKTLQREINEQKEIIDQLRETTRTQNAATEKVEIQSKRIGSLLETLKAQDECIADLKRQLTNTAVFIAEPPPPAAELPATTEPRHRSARLPGKRKVRETPSTNTLSVPAVRRLGWDEFDQTVRSEMKRLAPMPGVMVGYKLWDDQRDAKLPTMQAVIRRYGCETAPQLANKLGLEPPLGKGQPKTDEASEDGAE